jgi:hypothetical protein
VSLFDDITTRGNYPCPWCGEDNDAATPIKEPNAVPKAGDIALCATCARPSIYQGHGKPRKPTENEWRDINADRSITKARQAIFMTNHGNVVYRDMDVTVTDDDA